MALARVTDPHTSYEAADSISDLHRSDLQAKIELAIGVTGGLIDEELEIMFQSQASPSSIRTRRKELERMGLIRDSGRTAPTRRGRQAVIWEKVPA